MTKIYKPKPGDILFRTWKRDRPGKIPYCGPLTEDEIKAAGRPREFYVNGSEVNVTRCPCKLKYHIVLASLPVVWQRLARKAGRIDPASRGYFTCNCQGRIIEPKDETKGVA